MYLRSLEMQGFKSFPDKITLEFDKGITAVVGPNGSGKSNIGDAVRWVLGEQSSKTLRGAKMEDVIFAGTQLRRPMGFASVTLNIANDDHVLNSDSDNVAVTRKLYRSGESEYMINGEQVSLKDISELFMDTGLGRDGYSIIGQGKVAEIVSSRSSERRSIFEEAAGISRARYHKEEAERQLEKAEENISRLTDTMSVYEEQLAPLKIQAEKAEKYVVLAQERKSLEITIWMDSVGKLREKIKDLEEKIVNNASECQQSDAQIEKLESAQDELSRQTEELNIELDSLQADLLSNEQSNSADIADIAVLENEIKHAQERIEQLKASIEGANNSREEDRRAAEEKAHLAEEISAQIHILEESVSKCEEELRGTSDMGADTDRKQSELDARLSALCIRRTEINTAIAAAKDNLDDMTERRRIAAEQLTDADQRKNGLDREEHEVEEGLKVVTEKQLEQVNRISGMKRIQEGKGKKLESLTREMGALSSEMTALRERHRILTDLENSMEGYGHAVKAVLRAAKNGQLRGVRGTVSQLIDVDPEYSVAIETALGGALQNIVTSDEDTAKRGIRLLKDMNAGRATFLPMTSVRGSRLNERMDGIPGFIALACDLIGYDDEYEGIIDQLLGRIAVAENIDQAGSIARRFGYKFRVVTLDGQVVNAGGSYTGGSANRSSGILTRKNEIDSISADLEQRQSRLSALKEEEQTLRAQFNKSAIELEALEEEQRRIEGDKIRYDAELRRIREMREQLGSSGENAKRTLSDIEKRYDTVTNSVTENESRLAKLVEEIAAAKAASGEAVAERERIAELKEQLSDRIAELRIQTASLTKDRENALAAIESLKEKSRLAGEGTVELALEIKDRERFIGDSREKIAAVREKLSDSGKRSESIRQQIDGKRRDKLALERRDSELRGELKQANDVKSGLSAERIRLNERRDASLAERDKILSDMAEQYELYPSEAEKLVIPDADIPELNSRLLTVKNRIRSLGSINLEAIDDYKATNEKYQLLSSQLSDVNASKKELIRLIDEYTATMQRQFSENFDRINTQFKQIFTELFGGGRAELKLSDPDDVLTSGIDINVAPPGKVIGNLSLLSGGEQAFVAIAIYFAILRVRPAPFCILDEIEAALDDVNVSRYAQYMHNFTDTTQFITITHRRGTMEEADVFYGVTMQEKGISKLLRMEQLPAEAE
ncbi:MAG: chromosome segregation protein SMC [Oscillospiraceae bacterium]|nr:chromosome segregation protein SMC [Oscillospiraceae bacterium]